MFMCYLRTLWDFCGHCVISPIVTDIARFPSIFMPVLQLLTLRGRRLLSGLRVPGAIGRSDWSHLGIFRLWGTLSGASVHLYSTTSSTVPSLPVVVRCFCGMH